MPGFDLNALGRAALEMGGDYYDFFWVSPGQLGLVVADVSGKGVPAALTMAMLRTVMRTHAIADPSAHNVLVRTNAAIVADLPPGTFITVLYGILDIERRVFTWVRAGHEPVLLVRAGHVESHAPGGAAIGVLAPEEFGQALEVQEVALASGDAVVLYTDGITEAMNRDGDEFGPERFLAAVDSAGFSSAERIRHVDESVSAFVGDAPQQDDITLVVLTAR